MNFDITGLSLDDLILDLTSVTSSYFKNYKSDLSDLSESVVISDKLISSNSYSEVFRRIDRALPKEIEIFSYEFKYFRWIPLSVLLSLLSNCDTNKYNNILIAVIYGDQYAISFNWKASDKVFGIINNNQVIIPSPKGGLYKPFLDTVLDRPAYVSLIDMTGYNLSIQIESINKMTEDSPQETKQSKLNSSAELKKDDDEFEEDLVCIYN